MKIGKIEVDPKIMEELLNKPDIKEHVEKMTPATLAWYKVMLVQQGIYQKYVEEREAK